MQLHIDSYSPQGRKIARDHALLPCCMPSLEDLSPVLEGGVLCKELILAEDSPPMTRQCIATF